MQKIVTNLWFDNQAEEAVKFYTSIFKNSKILKTMYYGEAGAEMSGQPEGSVMTIHFTLDGQEFIAINGGPMFKFTHAISLMVNCKDQAEIDRLWEALGAEGEYEPCGWLQDKYGLSWQIVPSMFEDMVSDKDEAKTDRVMRAMGQMQKLDIRGLQDAARG